MAEGSAEAGWAEAGSEAAMAEGSDRTSLARADWRCTSFVPVGADGVVQRRGAFEVRTGGLRRINAKAHQAG
jgi:hypothetical protein